MIANITGCSGSGKTTLVAKVEELYPHAYVRLISYTSRARRKNEVDGEAYRFVDSGIIEDKKDFVLQRVRKDGIYAIKKSDLFSDGNKMLVTTFPASGVLKLEQLGCVVVPFFLSLDSSECEKRMIDRGDDLVDVQRRLLGDLTESTLEVTQNILGNRTIQILNGSLPSSELARLVHGILSVYRNKIE